MKTLEAFDVNALRKWLATRGWRFGPTPHTGSNEVDWFAYRFTDLPAPSCDTNGRIQVAVTPYALTVRDLRVESVEVEVVAERGGTWWKLKAYGVRPQDVPEQLDAIERRLIAAWSAIAS